MVQGHYDVVITGYGPTGLAAASLLARRGHKICVFERWATLYGLPRMATIDGESARILQAASDIDAALRHSLPRRRYLFANEKGEILIDHDWDKPHLCGFPFRISLHQPDIEDAMDTAARERGAEINQTGPRDPRVLPGALESFDYWGGAPPDPRFASTGKIAAEDFQTAERL